MIIIVFAQISYRIFKMRSRSSSYFIDLEYLLSDRPLSWEGRVQLKAILDGEVKDFIHNLDIDDEKLNEKISTRISFGYFPGTISENSISNDVSINSEKVGITEEREKLQVSLEFLFKPIEKAEHLFCYIKRTKSTLYTIYKLYLEDIIDMNQFVQTPRNFKIINQSIPLLIAKKPHGLNTSMSICSILHEDFSVFDDSNVIAKVSKSGVNI